MIEIRRAADRTVTYGDGITTRHGFSSGAHYDPANVSFGRLVAHDLHVLAPGAGFDTHRHRGVEIISWVLAGTLLHNDDIAVRHGTVQHLSAGDGVDHSERNGGADELRFVQMWLLGEPGEPAYRCAAPGIDLPGARFDVLSVAGPTRLDRVPLRHLYVADGPIELAGATLHVGDEVRITDEAVALTGTAELLSIVQNGLR